MAKEETITTREILLKQLEDPDLPEYKVAQIERKLKVLNSVSA